jgi:hypothetical protein
MAQERALPPRLADVEEVEPRQLEQPDERRQRAPADEHEHRRAQVVFAAHEQRDGRRKQGVLDELRRRSEVLRQRVAREDRRPVQRGRDHPGAERGGRDPERERGAEHADAAPARLHGRNRQDGDDREVGEAGVEGGRPDGK